MVDTDVFSPSTIISLLALLVSITSMYIVYTISKEDYKISQKIKSDIIILIATLKAIAMKSMFSTFQGNHKINAEQKKILEFLHSTTGMLFYSLVAKKNQENKKEWKLLFIYFLQLLLCKDSNISEAGYIAVSALIILNTLNEDDIDYLTSQSRDIKLLIAKSNEAYDLILASLRKKLDERNEGLSMTMYSEIRNFVEFVKFVKNIKKIDDPDVDIFIAVDIGDLKMVGEALDRNADPTISKGQIKERYKDYLNEFNQLYPDYAINRE
jgi:hypothetical protein